MTGAIVRRSVFGQASTLAAWRERFEANRERVAGLYDERFCRMWDFYLQSCEAGFRWSGLTVFQLQITKSIDALPMTRDYMISEEDRLRAADAMSVPEPQPVRGANAAQPLAERRSA